MSGYFDFLIVQIVFLVLFKSSCQGSSIRNGNNAFGDKLCSYLGDNQLYTAPCTTTTTVGPLPPIPVRPVISPPVSFNFNSDQLF